MSSHFVVKDRRHQNESITSLENVDSFMEKSSSEERVNFPFVETASGNLKIVPQQVVYESKQLSIVAANPRRTKVNIKADRKKRMSGNTDDKFCQPWSANLRAGTQDAREDELSNAMRRVNIPSKVWRDINLMQEGGGDRDSDGDGESCDHCLFTVDQNRTHIAKLNDEMSLAKFGFSHDLPVNWERNQLPEKTDLYHLLESRITNYINPDILVKIGNHEYRCHLLVLQCYSGFFLDKPKGRIEISEKDVSKAAFSYIYDWMLHKGPNSYHLLRRDNILEIFMAAQYLQVKDLEEQCWAFIDSEDLFNEDKAFLLYLDARAADNTAVMELMVPRIQRFFLTLVASKDFLDLTVQEVVVFLSSNYICVHSEMEVFMSAVRWLLYSWEKRQKHAVDVMGCIRFGLLEPNDLVNIQRNPENKEYRLVTDNPRVATMIEDGLAYAIVKYWNEDKATDYEHNLDSLGLSPPVPRHWAGNSGGKNTIKKYETFLNEMHKYRQMHIMVSNQAAREKGGDSGEPYKKSETAAQRVVSDHDLILPRHN